MKKLLIYLIMLSYTIVLIAQEEQKDPNEIRTLLGSGGKNGAYGSVSLGYTGVESRDAIVMGMSGAWIINHSFALGMSGSAFISDFRYDNALQKNANLSGGYGGLLLEPILFAKSPIHITIPVVIGAGGVTYGREYKMHQYDNDDSDNYYAEDACPYAFIKPGIEVEMNLISFIRLSIGAYYLQTSKIDLMNTSKNALNGFSGSLSLKFGIF
jgi:hypothetical protein